MSKLEDICYRMYETSGNSKYIRAEWAGKPFHPDQAIAQIKQLIRDEVIGKEPIHAEYCSFTQSDGTKTCNCGVAPVKRRVREQSKRLDEL